MALTEEQSQKIKEHLSKQLSNFPEKKRDEIKTQIESMSPEQIENFIQQNQLTHLGGQCVFCSIISGKNPSFKIAENNENIAILELNPLSKGHTLIIPKEHLDKILESSKNLAEEVSRKIQEKFNPQKIQINEIKIMEHALLEVIPIYGNETERSQASEEILKELQNEILKPSEEIEINPKKEGEEILLPKLPPRIP